MLDDFKDIETAFSLGVGPNVDWDFKIAERGIPVHQFDHTVDGSPRRHRNFHFHRRMIAASDTPDTVTLATMLNYATTHRPASSILKIDIENAEWSVFSTASQDVFAKFSQILVEFHAFEHFHEDAHFETAFQGLTRLKQQFEVIHVHANNSAGMTYIDDAALPFVIEATLANRWRYDTTPSSETFPTRLDLPNDPSKPDYDLGRFEL